jgi:hypothetical protein
VRQLDQAQRNVADEAEALGAVATAILQAIGEFRGYGYVAATDVPHEEDWMVRNLEGLLKKLNCGQAETQNGAASGHGGVHHELYAASKAEAPVDSQDVDMASTHPQAIIMLD